MSNFGVSSMYLGIDLGTSSVKLVLMNEEQEIIAQNSQPLTVSQPEPLWSEQQPEDWWQATCAGMHVLKQDFAAELAAVKSIGLSGQQHGATLLDKNGSPLRPAILWNDGRSMTQCNQLEAEIQNYAQITGSRTMPGFTAPKILWVAQNEPGVFKQLAKILLPKDYLRFKITGDYASDMSDTSGTSWLNVKDRCWFPEMLDATGLAQTHMPKLYEGSEITGTVTKAIAEQWGISANTTVVGGGGDNPAGAISVNVIKSGEAFLSLGTSGVYFVASDRYQANPQGGVHTFCHCVPHRWHHMTVHLSAASCLTWLAGTLNISAQELILEAENSPIKAKENNLIFLPYLSGERSPHNNPYASGVFFGLTHATTRVDLTRAVLEGVAFSFADGQDAMLQAGIEIGDVSVVGGGAQSFYWGKILASALQRPLIYRTSREVGSAFGAARLAWLAVNKADPETAFISPAIEKIIDPDSELCEQYLKKREVFKQLYFSLQNIF